MKVLAAEEEEKIPATLPGGKVNPEWIAKNLHADPRDEQAWFEGFSGHINGYPYALLDTDEHDAPDEILKALEARKKDHERKLKEFLNSTLITDAFEKGAHRVLNADFDTNELMEISANRGSRELKDMINRMAEDDVDIELVNDVLSNNLQTDALSDAMPTPKLSKGLALNYVSVFQDIGLVSIKHPAETAGWIQTGRWLLEQWREDDNGNTDLSDIQGIDFIRAGHYRTTSFELQSKYQWALHLKIHNNVLEELERLLEQNKGYEDAEIKKKAEKPQYDASLDANQLALLRWMEQNQKQSVTWSELEKLPFGKSPLIQKALTEKNAKKGSKKDWEPITVQDIAAQPKKPANDVMKAVQQSSEYSFKTFPPDLQVLFDDEPNRVFLRSMTEEDFTSQFLSEDGWQEELKNVQYHNKNSKHPYQEGHITLAWVRFTILESDQVWIDEIQTDFFDEYIGNNWVSQDFAKPLSSLLKDTVEVFLAKMRSLGYEKFIIPDLQIAKDLYNRGNRTPKYPYDILPGDLKFQKQPMSNDISTWADDEFNKNNYKEHPVWVQAGAENHHVAAILEEIVNVICAAHALKRT